MLVDLSEAESRKLRVEIEVEESYLGWSAQRTTGAARPVKWPRSGELREVMKTAAGDFYGMARPCGNANSSPGFFPYLAAIKLWPPMREDRHSHAHLLQHFVRNFGDD
jgi:hypothetical protein